MCAGTAGTLGQRKGPFSSQTAGLWGDQRSRRFPRVVTRYGRDLLGFSGARVQGEENPFLSGRLREGGVGTGGQLGAWGLQRSSRGAWARHTPGQGSCFQGTWPL